MSVEIDKTTIKTFQGDTCEITFTELEPNGVYYFEVRDRKFNKPVFKQFRKIANAHGEVTYTIEPELTNKFEVKASEGVNTYYYGLKKVDETTGEENTVLLGENGSVNEKYYIKVYLKKAEGISE